MHTGLDLLVLMTALAGAWLAAAFAALGYFKARQAAQLLTAQGAATSERAAVIWPFRISPPLALGARY